MQISSQNQNCDQIRGKMLCVSLEPIISQILNGQDNYISCTVEIHS